MRCAGNMLVAVGVLGAAVLGGAGSPTTAQAAGPASDDASAPVYLNFPNPDGLNGLNGGSGFGPWSTSKRISSGYNEPAWPGFAGWFQAFGNIGAAGNPDLEDIGTVVVAQNARPAWGSYANSSQPDRGVSITAATRDFTDGELQPGQTFSVQMEHGNVSSYPSIFDLRCFGWVGVVLHTNSSWAPDPFQNGLGFFGVVGFGFRGGRPNYEIVSPAGTEDTGIPFTQRGLKVDFRRDTLTSLTLTVTRLSDNQQWSFTRPLGFGQLNGFGLVNRYAREANVYFNKVSVVGTPLTRGACCTGAACVLREQADCASAGVRFAGIGSVCNAPGVFTTPCCAADFDQSGARTIDDLFIYLNAWFANDPLSDVDAQNGRTIDDLFIFLNLWFAGC